MKIDDYTKISHKRNRFKEDNDQKINYLKNLVTRILLSIILVISISIFIKLDSENVLLVDEYVFQDSLKFTTINKWYQKYFGNVLPNVSNDTKEVFSSDDLFKNKYTNYLDGVKIEFSKSSPVSIITGGIVVFLGEKEGYGNTVIIQGNDGIDYWYGGITNTSVNLYDYLEKDTLIGEVQDNCLYLVLEKDGQYLNYDEYISKI